LARRARIGLDRSAAVDGANAPTPREQAVLALGAGRTNRQIGDELFISENGQRAPVPGDGQARRCQPHGGGQPAYERGLLAPSAKA
jgi:hypothetical protein